MLTVQENPTHGAFTKEILPKLASPDNKFHLPGLGRTVSHTMSNQASKNNRFSFDQEDFKDDPKVME